MKRTKLTALALSATLLLSSAFALTAAAEGETPVAQAETKPEIISKNIAYTGNFGLMLAIDPDTVAGGGVSVEVFSDAAATKSLGVFSAELAEWTIGGVKKDYYTVTTLGIASKDLAVQYYFRATDAAGNKGDVERYSAAEYFFERTYICESTADQIAIYNNALALGASVQKVLTPDATPVTDYKLVSVTGGTLADGTTQAIVVKDTEVTVTPTGECVGWKVTDLTTNANSDTEVNTVEITTHTSIDAVSYVYKYANGLYYKQFTANQVPYESFTTLWTTTYVERSNGYMERSAEAALTDSTKNTLNIATTVTLDDGTKKFVIQNSWDAGPSGNAVAASHATDGMSGAFFKVLDANKDATNTVYVFETDFYLTYNKSFDFTATSSGRQCIPDGTTLFGFVPGKSTVQMQQLTGEVGKTYGTGISANIDANGAITSYDLNGTTISGETWYNLRIELDTAGGTDNYKVYLNNTLVQTLTSDVTELTNLAVAVHRYAQSGLSIHMDNTYFGTTTLPQ